MVFNRCQVNSNLPECGLFLVNLGTHSAKISLKKNLKIIMPPACWAFSPLQGTGRMIFMLAPPGTDAWCSLRDQVTWENISIDHNLGYGFGIRETKVPIPALPPICCEILGNRLALSELQMIAEPDGNFTGLCDNVVGQQIKRWTTVSPRHIIALLVRISVDSTDTSWKLNYTMVYYFP